VTDHVWTLQELLMYRVPPRAPENIVSIDEGHQSKSTLNPKMPGFASKIFTTSEG
jgi:hypothetical protein